MNQSSIKLVWILVAFDIDRSDARSETRGNASVATSLTRALPCETPPGGRSESRIARTCIRKMADSGDGVNSTSSGKETRGTLADGPVTDPASSMKVNRAGLRSNLKSRAVPRAPSDVRANLTAVCHGCRICRRSHDGRSARARPERAFNITVDNTSRIDLSLVPQIWELSTFVLPSPLHSRRSFRIFLSFSQCLFHYPPFPPYLCQSISFSPAFLLSRPTLRSLVMITCGSYAIEHMALIGMSFIDEWALVKSRVFIYLEYTRTPVCCDWILISFPRFPFSYLLNYGEE